MPQIYVIYRPEDGRKRNLEIIESLKKLYGASNLKHPNFDGYVDVYQIERDVQKCQYLIVIIGKHWADMIDESGQNLLNNVYDPVHMAIATAVNSRKRMIPILVDGAEMPRRNRLPQEIRAITTVETIKIAKNANPNKILSKGLKDIIKRTPMSRLPDFNMQIKLPKRTRQSVQPRLRQPVQPRLHPMSQPRRDWQYWLKRGVLPTIALGIFVVSIAIMLIPRTVNVSVEQSKETVPVSLATVAPVSTATTMTRSDSTLTEISPQIVTPQRQPITVSNAQFIQKLSQDGGSLSSSETVIFSQDKTLFIFVTPELQEVQIKEVATGNTLKIIDFAPDTPLYVALNDDESQLFVLSNVGVSTWGIP